MPTNKNAQIRYFVLDKCFSDFSRRYSIDDLLDNVNDVLIDQFGKGICLRQIREDIKNMRERTSFNAPIKAYPWDGKKCYYRYTDSDFSIFNNDLTTEEVTKLKSMIEMLGRFRGIPGNTWLEEVISNLEYRFGIRSNSEHVIAFAQNDQLKGLEYLSDLIDAAVNHIPLKIDYKTYRGKEISTTLHPYHIKQYNNRWFLLGYEEESGKIANKALDRIRHISHANVPFIPNENVDFSHFFDDVVGVTIPKNEVKKETIILRFTEARFPYVTSKPIHQTQKTLNEDEHTITIEVKPTRELEQQILSFGSDVEVLSPEAYRNQIGEKIAEMMKKYFPVQDDCIGNE